MICTSCLDHITDGVCYDCHEASKERILELESLTQEFVDCWEKLCNEAPTVYSDNFKCYQKAKQALEKKDK